MEPRLKTALWVSAQVRMCDAACIPAAVSRRGDPDSGQVLIKRNLLDGRFEVFARSLTIDGAPAWRRACGPEAEPKIDRIIAREAGFDPDLWVIEIEDPHFRYAFDAPIV